MFIDIHLIDVFFYSTLSTNTLAVVHRDCKMFHVQFYRKDALSEHYNHFAADGEIVPETHGHRKEVDFIV